MIVRISIQVVSHCLRKGGYWINFGPLLYHWVDNATYMPQEELSIELSLEGVLEVATAYNLTCLRHETIPSAHFVSNARSMCPTVYNCSFFTMIRT